MDSHNTYTHGKQNDLGPLPNYLPSYEESRPDATPYHDWASVPDTILLPPPPALDHERSPTSNADLSDAVWSYGWCETYPLVKPHRPTIAQVSEVKAGNLGLIRPKEYSGSLLAANLNSWKGSTLLKSRDTCLITSLPLYFAVTDSPFVTKATKTIYYETKVLSLGPSNDCSIAIGFCAVPYPTWRMPGWERGSLAVHADDGRRYVNDTDGGKEFTTPFKVGDIVGIGMTFRLLENPIECGKSPMQRVPVQGEVFFTRNGKKEGYWDLHEELDAENEFGVLGIDGQYDLYGAIGVFGQVKFEANFSTNNWLWQPTGSHQ
ncbi:MAG: hypothetical protein MMC33_000008 [Icmadophila ericetorum]|nr:hypothetical protein [Icmadophila ericetorum]